MSLEKGWMVVPKPLLPKAVVTQESTETLRHFYNLSVDPWGICTFTNEEILFPLTVANCNASSEFEMKF